METILKFVGDERTSNGKLSVAAFEHRAALLGRYCAAQGEPLRKMLEGWAEYADAYKRSYACAIGTDGVIGAAWQEIGEALQVLLNGTTGGWDSGSLHANIGNMLADEGAKVAP